MGRDERRQTKLDKLFSKKNNDVLSAGYSKLRDVEDDDGSDEDLFKVASKPRHLDNDGDGGASGAAESIAMPRSKRSLKKIRVTDANPGKLVFDEEGNAVSSIGMMAKEGVVKPGDLDAKAHYAMMQVCGLLVARAGAGELILNSSDKGTMMRCGARMVKFFCATGFLRVVCISLITFQRSNAPWSAFILFGRYFPGLCDCHPKQENLAQIIWSLNVGSRS